MRILILAPRLPWPPRDGGRIAMSRLASSLAGQGAIVEVLSLNPRKHRAPLEAAPIPTQAIDIDTSRILAPLVRSMISNLPWIVARFASSELRDALREKLRSFCPDVVQIESPFMLQYASTVRAESSAKIVLRSLNVEFRIWERLRDGNTRFVHRLALGQIARSLKRYEVTTLNEVDAVVPISSDDADDFRSLGCTRPVHVAPCGVTRPDQVANDLTEGARPTASVGFIGSLDFKPNQEAVVWILEKMWPLLQQRSPQAQLMIAGSSAPAWLLTQAAERGVTIQTDIEDANTFMRSVSVMIAPIFAGGGMRIKVLEAMAIGKPVVATSLGAGGLIAENGRDILIADDAQSFAAAVERLLADGEEAKRIGENARATVAANYDSDVIAAGLLRFYDWLADSPRDCATEPPR